MTDKIIELANLCAATPDTINEWFESVKTKLPDFYDDNVTLAWLVTVINCGVSVDCLPLLIDELIKGDYLIDWLKSEKHIYRSIAHRNLIYHMRNNIDNYEMYLHILGE